MLANHIWSFAGDDDRPDISNTFMQPFVAYTGPSAWTASVQSETSYNRKAEQWSIPVNLGVSKLVKFGKLPVSLQGGVGYWADSPDNGPEGFRFGYRRTPCCRGSGLFADTSQQDVNSQTLLFGWTLLENVKEEA